MKGKFFNLTIFMLAASAGLCLVAIKNSFLIPTNSIEHTRAITNVESIEISEQVRPEVSTKIDNGPEFLPSPDGVYFPVSRSLEKNEVALIMNFYDGESSGSVKVGKDFIDGSVTIDESGLIKITSNRDRTVRYEFEGKFLKDGFNEFFEDGDRVLKGTFTKYQKDKKVYSIQSEYTFAAEVCAWNPNNQEF